jgi:hypothetical protein
MEKANLHIADKLVYSGASWDYLEIIAGRKIAWKFFSNSNIVK